MDVNGIYKYNINNEIMIFDNHVHCVYYYSLIPIFRGFVHKEVMSGYELSLDFKVTYILEHHRHA